MEDPHDPYAALRLPGYRRLLGGGVLSSLGAEMLAVVAGYEIYERTDDPLALGLVGLVQFLPVLLLALPAGHAADRYSRARILVGAQALMAIAAMGLAILSYIEGPLSLVYICLTLIGVSRAFNAPARQSLLAQIVPAEILPSAVAWNSTGWQLANMVGPVLGGFALVFITPAGAYCFTAASSLLCAGLVASIRLVRPPTQSIVPRSLEGVLAGVRFVYANKPILATITLDLFVVLLGGATALLPVYAKDILNVGPDGLGWLRAAPAIGAAIMAVTLAHRRPFQRPAAPCWAPSPASAS